MLKYSIVSKYVFYFLQGYDNLNRYELTSNISVVFLGYINVLVPYSYNDKKLLNHKHECKRHDLFFKCIHVQSMNKNDTTCALNIFM